MFMRCVVSDSVAFCSYSGIYIQKRTFFYYIGANRQFSHGFKESRRRVEYFIRHRLVGYRDGYVHASFAAVRGELLLNPERCIVP